MKPQSRGDIEFQVRMMHAMKPPQCRHRMEHHVLQINCQIKQQQRKARQSLMGKARYHAKHLAAPSGTASSADWQKLTAALEELVRAGVPPSDVEIRELAIECLRQLQGAAPNAFADFRISALPDGTEIAASPYALQS